MHIVETINARKERLLSRDQERLDIAELIELNRIAPEEFGELAIERKIRAEMNELNQKQMTYLKARLEEFGDVKSLIT
jgi:hypothetical protein